MGKARVLKKPAEREENVDKKKTRFVQQSNEALKKL